MKNFTKKAFLKNALLILMLVLLISLLSGCAVKMYINPYYNVGIYKPDNVKELRNVTVYLPFPEIDGKPDLKIYKSILRYKKDMPYFSRVYAKYGLLKTKHGYMLKIFIPKLDDAFFVAGGYTFERLYTREKFWQKVKLGEGDKYRKASTKNNYTTLTTGYIYLDFPKDQYIGMEACYGVNIAAPWILPLDYIPCDHYTAYFGLEEIPKNKEMRWDKRFDKTGWIKIPIVEGGYY